MQTKGIDLIALETTRLFSQSFISKPVIETQAQLIAIVEDINQSKIPITSVDTRKWKSLTCTNGKIDKTKTKKQKKEIRKQLSVDYIKNIFGILVNDDIADALCMAIAATIIYNNNIKEK